MPTLWRLRLSKVRSPRVDLRVRIASPCMAPGSDATGVEDDVAWPALPASLVIADGQVHVVRACAQAASAPAFASALPSDERARAARFRRPASRARFVAGRVVLRELLGRCVQRAASDGPFVSSPAGKPHLLAGPSFSISHSGNMVLVALARADVGVDVEAPRPLRDPVTLARRWLDPPAAEDLAGMDPGARPAAFLALWTRHEAVLKCRGVGLAGSPSQSDGLTVRSLTLPNSYTGAIAAPAPFALWQWTWPPDAPVEPDPRA